MRIFFFLLLFLPTFRVAFSQDIFDLQHITEIRIQFKEADWSQQLDLMKQLGNDQRLPASVSIDGKSFELVGVRYKGNSSYKNPKIKGQRKLPFNLKADFIKKDQRFPGGYETLKLTNVFQDPSFVREVLSYEIARKYMAAPRANFCKIWVNDEYFGLYNNTESVDEAFLEKAFSTSKGTLIKCDPEWEDVKDLDNGCPEGDKAALMYVGENPECYKGWYELQNNDKTGWQELIALAKTMSQKPEQAASVINVDATLWMLAFNNILVNLDSYTGRLSHNFYLYKTPDGVFTPIVWDMNISFGGFRFDGEKMGVLNNEDLQDFSLFAHYKNKNPKRPLITGLLNNPLWRKIYVGHCHTILQENFANGEYLRLGADIQKRIDAEVKNDPQKLYAYEGFQKNLVSSVDIGSTSIIGIEELMKKRTEKLLAHPLFKSPLPAVSEVAHSVAGDKLLVTAHITNAPKAWLAWRLGSTAAFKFQEMYDSGTAGDGAAGDQTWGASIIMQPGIQYYLVAEGDRIATCSPERAAFRFYEVK